MNARFLAAVLTSAVIGWSVPAIAQTAVGALTLNEEDIPAAAAYCNALLAEQGGGDVTTLTEDAAAAAPETVNNDTGPDGAASASETANSAGDAGTVQAGVNAEVDLTGISVEQCQEAGLLDQ